jgi:hypothetical protein
MKWIVLGLLFWLLVRLWQWLRGLWDELVDVAARPRSDLGEERHRLLALAEPMAVRSVGEAFIQSAAPADRDDRERRVRAALLHLFKLRGDNSPEQLQRELPQLLRTRWFSIDLDDTRPEDNPADALAFACGRVAFAVRLAGLLGWIDDDTQWQLLQQNAQRARECFASWAEYGSAWARGRRQWVARSRADGLGFAFSEADVQAWTADRSHPWGYMAWEAAPAPA